ncbi:APC family permease [Streptomyces sp. NBC_01321]|uniref:APC family permease n=1 Tax=unclassified Streptomyces TaxID=2593676 RepID=UPI002E0F8AE0|nr:APC family permease [Streptomyces sp. NBC_01321]WSU20948.1 APC family permease [Streptomyces sp. NBC_01108]
MVTTEGKEFGTAASTEGKEFGTAANIEGVGTAANSEGKSTAGFRRVLTLRHLVAFGLAYLAPTVVFNYYGIITDLTDGMMALAYVVTLVAMFFTAYSYAQMVRAFPVSGSAYSYVRKAVNPWLGFGTGWVMLLDYLLLPMVCYLLFGIYMNEYVPSVPVAAWVIAGAFLGALVNVLGVKVSGRLNVVLVSAQILFCLSLIGLITAYVLGGDGSGSLLVPQALVDVARLDPGNILWAASILSVSFLGFDAVSTLAEETKDARKTVPRGILIVCVGAGVGFAVISYFLQIAWPSAPSAMKDPDVGIFELLPRIGGEGLSTAFLVTDQTASILCAMAAIAAVSRVLYGMGRDRLLPVRFFGHLSPRFGTPVNNIVFTSAIALTAVFFSDNLLGAASLTSFGAITGFLLVNFSVINHYYFRERRRTGTDAVRFLVMPAIGIAVNVVLWVNIDTSAKLLGLGWLTLGGIYLGAVTKGFRLLPQPILDEDG